MNQVISLLLSFLQILPCITHSSCCYIYVYMYVFLTTWNSLLSLSNVTGMSVLVVCFQGWPLGTG